MKRLLVFDYFRGTDSTGLASVRNVSNEIMVVKGAVVPTDLFQFKKFETVLTGGASKAFIGHNRAATQGKVNSVNAHPFHYGAVVGAHNGTLDRPSWTRLEEVIGFQTNVDSEAIIAAIDAIGIDDTVALMEEGRASTTGAWALTWYDSRDDTLNFLRNPHRPLWRAWSEDHKKLFWASEWAMIRAAIDLAPTEYKLHTDAEGHSYRQFAENTLYSVNATELKAGRLTPNDFTRRTLKGRAPVVYATPAGFQGGASSAGQPPFSTTPQHQHSRTQTSGNSSRTTPSQQAGGGNGKVIDLFGRPEDPILGYVGKVKFEEWAKGGCAWCENPVAYGDPGLTIYESLEQVLCSECSHDSKVTRIYGTPTSIADYMGVLRAVNE